jgi:hypothetical protein
VRAALSGRSRLDKDEDALASEDPLLALLTTASIRSRITTGPEAGKSWRRFGDRDEPVEAGEGDRGPGISPPPRCVRPGGMSLCYVSSKAPHPNESADPVFGLIKPLIASATLPERSSHRRGSSRTEMSLQGTIHTVTNFPTGTLGCS